MITQEQLQSARRKVSDYLAQAGIVITADEADNIEVSDMGLGDLDSMGLQVVVYVNTDRVCAKELVLFPRQTCPEHRHPPVAGEPGKEETFRCRWGQVLLYVPGDPTPSPRARTPAGHEPYYTVWHEIVLDPGQQYTLSSNTLHWFQAGDQGAVVSEFSTTSRDETDIWTDPGVVREMAIEEVS